MDNILSKPIRWEQLLRYQLIEIMVLWEGRIITNHLSGAFGIGRQQASKDINTYIAQYPNNLEYDRKAKGYVPTEMFDAKFTKGTANEYLHLLNSNTALKSVFEKSEMPASYTEVLSVPNRSISPDILRPLIKSCREKLRLEITYCSMTSPEGEERIISPHSLVFSGLRWHVRAYCEKHRDYRDFVINRISSVDDEMGEAIENDKNDMQWYQKIDIEVCPNPNLSTAQQALIARDYNMNNGILTLTERVSLIHYALDQLQVYCGEVKTDNTEHLVLKNREELYEYIK
ncbi:MAG: putative DNA-binding transcriptional regulator YafY [Alteromonadaceae bacterium]|jgi:predicted DNA-binding transcriptional regulator YafY